MTDKEIKKALECCKVQEGCESCPMYDGTDDCCPIIRDRGAEIENLKAVAKAELDTIHKLGDDYERVLEGMEECKAIIVQQQAENERLRSLLKEIVGD